MQSFKQMLISYCILFSLVALINPTFISSGLISVQVAKPYFRDFVKNKQINKQNGETVKEENFAYDDFIKYVFNISLHPDFYPPICLKLGMMLDIVKL